MNAEDTIERVGPWWNRMMLSPLWLRCVMYVVTMTVVWPRPRAFLPNLYLVMVSFVAAEGLAATWPVLRRRERFFGRLRDAWHAIDDHGYDR